MGNQNIKISLALQHWNNRKQTNNRTSEIYVSNWKKKTAWAMMIKINICEDINIYFFYKCNNKKTADRLTQTMETQITWSEMLRFEFIKTRRQEHTILLYANMQITKWKYKKTF